MTDGEPESSGTVDEPEMTDLRPRRRRSGSGRVRPPRPDARPWQRLALGVSLLLLLAILLSSQPLVRDALGWLARAPASPTATAEPLPFLTPAATPGVRLATPTAVPGAPGVPALGAAPASCGEPPPTLTSAGPPPYRAVGRAPLWVGGFSGPYATLRLGPAASANAYGWAAPYTRYGWPAPILLVVPSSFAEPVTLSGWDLRDGHPLWFGVVEAGVWGPPTQVVPNFTLDPWHLSIPEGGDDDTGAFWYGYAFLPRAGCYALAATWAGGSWQVTVSAGR
jgi:hypothetical protein